MLTDISVCRLIGFRTVILATATVATVAVTATTLAWLPCLARCLRLIGFRGHCLCVWCDIYIRVRRVTVEVAVARRLILSAGTNHRAVRRCLAQRRLVGAIDGPLLAAIAP